MFQTRGTDGTLRYGYHMVARLSEWTLDMGKDVSQLNGHASEVNQYWAKEADSMSVILQIGKRERRWDGVQVSIAGDVVSATLEGRGE